MSHLEDKFDLFWRGLKGPTLEREYKFHPSRKWRSDFAHQDSKTLIEIEGGVWGNGRHNRGAGFTKDCEKYLEASLAGWRVIRLTGKQITAPILERIIANLTKPTNQI